MAVPTILSNTSPGAPALTGQVGGLYDVVKWALPQLGWSIEFDNGSSKIALSNSAVHGTGDVLRFDDDNANHDGDARSCNVRSYSSMSDIDTGTDEIGDSGWLITKSLTADTTQRTWVIIGDDVSFWLLIGSGNDINLNEYYLGDIASDKPGDAGAFLTQANNVTSISSASVVSPISTWGSTTIEGFSKLRFDITEMILGEAACYSQNSYSGVFASNSRSPGSYSTYPEPASGGIRAIDVQVKAQVIPFVIRGRLRGTLLALNDIRGEFTNGQVIANQATPRGLRDCVIYNRYARTNNASGDGVLMFDQQSDWNNW